MPSCLIPVSELQKVAISDWPGHVLLIEDGRTNLWIPLGDIFQISLGSQNSKGVLSESGWVWWVRFLSLSWEWPNSTKTKLRENNWTFFFLLSACTCKRSPSYFHSALHSIAFIAVFLASWKPWTQSKWLKAAAYDLHQPICEPSP